MRGDLYHAHPAKAVGDRTPFYEAAGAYLPTGFFMDAEGRKRIAEAKAARRAAAAARADAEDARIDAWLEAL